jgi:hypothetical protein
VVKSLDTLCARRIRASPDPRFDPTRSGGLRPRARTGDSTATFGVISAMVTAAFINLAGESSWRY